MQDISRVGTCCCQWSIVDVSVTCLTVAQCCRCVWYHRQWCFEHKTRERARYPVPVQTGTDGNCLPRAVSLLVFGDETHHLEVRCRIVSELVQNFDCYVQGKGMAEHEAGCQKVAALLAVLAEDGGLTEESATTEDIETMLRAEIMEVIWLKSHMGLWQHVQTSVQSVYPQKGWEVYRHSSNRLLQPRSHSSSVCCRSGHGLGQ